MEVSIEKSHYYDKSHYNGGFTADRALSRFQDFTALVIARFHCNLFDFKA